jgi:DNA-binding MarR family transcriptional regulator
MTKETDLVQQIMACSHKLVAVGRGLGAVTARSGAWGLMRSLWQNGPSAIPELARARPVSRQHIRLLSQSLVQRGWIEQTPNPAHRRSFLLQLTPNGERALVAMDRRIEGFINAWLVDVPADNIRVTLETLEALADSMGHELGNEKHRISHRRASRTNQP